MSRVAVVFGQFGIAADPVNLPIFRDRLAKVGIETILVQHTDTQKVYDFLHGYAGECGIVGSSLGAGVAPVMAGYLRLRAVQFVGGFQPSDWDPVMHPVALHGQNPLDLITRAVIVPENVREAVCFRNPVVALTGGLGHATYILGPGNKNGTKLTVIEREDIHPGDFPPAQDTMFAACKKALRVA